MIRLFPKFLFLILCFLFSCSSFKEPIEESITIHSLSCQYLQNPLGIDITKPKLSWMMESARRGEKQTAYQILVASSLTNLNSNKGDIWDSQKITSDQSVHIDYAGKQLASEMKCFWKVKVWDKDSKESKWSQPAYWTMGFLKTSDWKASWIGLEKAMGEDKPHAKHTVLSARYLRKEFNATKKVKSATAYICGIGVSELYLNGKKISNHVLSPALSEYNKRSFYVMHDVTDHIISGKNAIGVVLGNGRYLSPRSETVHAEELKINFPKMILRTNIEYEDGSKESIISDSTWRLTAEGPIVKNNEFDGEFYDARKEMPGWNKIGFDDNKWMPVQVIASPTKLLQSQMIDPIRVIEAKKPISVKTPKPNFFVYDFGQNMAGWIQIKVKGKAGTSVKIRYAEVLDKQGMLQTLNLRSAEATDIYVMKGSDSVQTYEPIFTTHGFRYVEITGAENLELSSVIAKVVHDDVKSTGRFSCSNNLLNKIYSNAIWCIRSTYRSVPVDSPQRDERQGWMGDRGTEAEGESYAFDTYKLYAKWLDDIKSTQKENGSISDVAPSFWPTYFDNTTWSGAYILFVDMIYRQYGDTSIIKNHYASMAKWIEHMKQFTKDDLMWKDTFGDWCVPPTKNEMTLIHTKDGGRSTAAEIIGTTYFYHELRLMEKFAKILAKDEEAKAYNTSAEKMKTAFNDYFLNKEFLVYGNNSATASILPLAFGMVPKEYEAKIVNNLCEKIMVDFEGHIPTGMLGLKWLLRTLTDYGRGDIAYHIATRKTYPSWGYTIENGATTIWELWNGVTGDPGMNSGSQPMMIGDYVIWIFENLAGINKSNEATGFKKIILEPTPVGDLKFVNASYKTLYGVVESNWKIEDDKFFYSVKVPVNSTAEVRLPSNNKNDVLENGKTISEGEVKFIKKDGDKCIYTIASGEYKFEIKNYNSISRKEIVETPAISMADSTLYTPAKVLVSLSTKTNGADIRYTLDGSSPSKNSTSYTKPIEINKYTFIKAAAFKKGIENSYTAKSIIDIADPAVNGLNYKYYEGSWNWVIPDFTKLKPKKTGRIKYFDTDPLKFRENEFCIVFDGMLEIPRDGTYTFFIRSNDSSKLFLDGKELINNDKISFWVDRTAKINLKAGKHPIKVEFLEGMYDEGLAVSFTGPGIPFQKIPASYLFVK